MIVSDYLDNFQPDSVVWASVDGKITCSQVRSAVTELRARIARNDRRRVVLEYSDCLQSLTWLIALDGYVDELFLVPQSIWNSSDYDELRSRFEPSLRIRDQLVFGEANPYADSVCNRLTRWVLATSGTTGVPKLIGHTTRSLTRSCKTDTSRGREFIWGLIYDPFRFAGLQVLLQAFSGGSKLVVCNSAESLSDQVSFLDSNDVTALSATPTYWRKLLMVRGLQLDSLRQITLGGEPADQSVLNALKKRFSKARIAHIYASTEIGVGFSVTDGLAGFPTEFLAQSSKDGVEFKISDEGSLLIRRRSANTDIDTIDAEFIDSGDLVEVRNGRVQFLGRDSGAINVGGNKVIPEEIESVIRELDIVAEVVVSPKGSALTGQLVSADIQLLRSDFDVASVKRKILDHCRSRLERYKVPALIRFVHEIQSNPSGKITRSN